MSVHDGEAILGLEPDDPGQEEAAAQVRAELEHHLACAAAALMEQGLDAEAARTEARRRFGDVEAIGRACVRIRRGGTVMMRRLHLGLTVVLALALVFMVFAQRQAIVEARVEAERSRMEAEQALALLLERQEKEEHPEPVEHIVIGVGDVLVLVDDHDHDLGEAQFVAADGKILLPGAGWVFVAGLTREEAESAVTEALRPFWDEVDVRIRVGSADPRR
jgi:cell division protein FtsL